MPGEYKGPQLVEEGERAGPVPPSELKHFYPLEADKGWIVYDKSVEGSVVVNDEPLLFETEGEAELYAGRLDVP